MRRASLLVLLVSSVLAALAGCDPPAPAIDATKAAATAAAVDPAVCDVPPDTSTTPPSCPKGCIFDKGKCTVDRGGPIHNITTGP